MVIGITVNEVLRDFIGQFTYTYKKYIDNEFDLKEGDVKTFDLLDYFKFDSKFDMNKFLYTNAALEIFGHADQTHDNIANHLNMFFMDMEDEEEHEVIIISREFDKSIPSTLFFLSKLGCKMSNIQIVKNHEDKWDYVDMLVTANPIAIKNKPEGKISVKVKSSYNEGVESDYEIDSILDFIGETETRELILNNENINE